MRSLISVSLGPKPIGLPTEERSDVGHRIRCSTNRSYYINALEGRMIDKEVDLKPSLKMVDGIEKRLDLLDKTFSKLFEIISEMNPESTEGRDDEGSK